MNYQQQNMYTGNNNMDGTPIELLRKDLKPQQNSKDDETHYSVGSIDTTSDIRNLVKEINSNIESKKNNNNNKNDKDTDTDTNTDTDTDTNKNFKKSKLSSKNIKNTNKNNPKKSTIKSNKNKLNKNKLNKSKSNKNKLNNNKVNNCNTWEDYLYDFILLFIIFMLMSQDFVKNFIGSKIKIINVNDKGIIPFSGVMVYGFIFVTVFICMKILINKVFDITL